jgi:hypothetical protein
MRGFDLIFYIAIGIGLLFLYMLKRDRPQRPTPLKMTAKSKANSKNNSKNYKHRQLTGAKAVKAEFYNEADENFNDSLSDDYAVWASPTIVVNGQVQNAYAVLGLDSGVPLAQVRSQFASLIQQKNTPEKIEILKLAYQAIVDRNNS